jgi:hypothetical protein
MFNAVHSEVLTRLNKSWPETLRLPLETTDSPNLTEHPLAGELFAFSNSAHASLPFFIGDKIAWFTLAANADQLRAAIEDLRAWIIPSFGWEDETQPLVAPGETTSHLGPLIHAISPAGYFRWWTTRANFKVIVEKLRAMRRLEEAQPSHAYNYVPSLFEIRQQFEVAMLTGSRESAQAAIESIDNNQLDTAANSRFMQVRLWDQFREYELIVTDKHVAEIVQLRMPHPIRLALVKAFHTHFLAPHEEEEHIQAAAQSYSANVHDLLAGVLDACRPSDGIEVTRCLAYKAWKLRDGRLASHLLSLSQDQVVQELLSALRTIPTKVPELEQEFMDSWRLGDWRSLQEVGQQLIESDQSKLQVLTSEYLLSTIRYSLSLHANPALAARLETIPVEPTAPPPTPQTWRDFVEGLRRHDSDAAQQFLSLDDRPTLDLLSQNEVSYVLEFLEDLFTDPLIDQNQRARQVLLGSLPIVIKDLLNDPEFPRSSFAGIYKQLFDLWSQQKRGSAFPQDANLLLALADVVLHANREWENQVAESLSEWWRARRVRAMLPFLLNSVDILSELTSVAGVCESLWIDGAELIRIDPQAISPGERTIWRSVGTRIGLDAPIIEEFLGSLGEVDATEVDLLTQVNLQKVAIVSLREESAETAAEIIRQRTGADVLLVAETHAGAATDSAKTADVILFVWASTTHSVFRAFDKVRNKLNYVEGTGAVSIVLTLERWAMRQLETTLA